MAWTAFELCINCAESYMIVYYLFRCLQFRSHARLWDILLFTSCTLFLSLFVIFPMPPIDMALFLIPLSFSYFFSKNSRIEVIYWNCILALVFALVAGLCTSMYLVISEALDVEMGKENLAYLAYIISSNTLIFMFLQQVVRLRKNEASPDSRTYISFFSTILVVFLCEEALYYFEHGITHKSDEQVILLLIMHVALIVLVYCVMLLFRVVSINALKVSKYQAELSILSLTEQHQKELTSTYNEMISYKHDIKHHLQVIDRLVSAGKGNEARHYLNDIQQDFQHRIQFITGCSAVDAILAAKNSTMKGNGICFQYTLCPLNELPISVVDFCSIVGNILDNAIEGVLRLKNGSLQQIQFSITRAGDMLYINCENPCDNSTICSDDGTYFSAKNRRGKQTGVGIESIKRIVAQTEGRCSFEIEDSVFCVQVVLPYLGSESK